ncbi:MAG: hypothetical protein IJJ33_05880, partial [Victivallales bacterium]|nr:hypothetical protein [Victivallales bacterium]
MSNFDTAMKMLFESDQAVADVFNACVGKGQRLIDASMVRPATERELDLIRHSNRKWHSQERIKDVVRCIKWNQEDPDDCLLLGLENQLHPHYLMPWRLQESYHLFFGRQLRSQKRSDKGKQKQSNNSAEFLSGCPKGTMFTRALTIVIYWGVEKWDAPVRLSEMFRPPPIKAVRKYELKLTCPLLIPAKIPLKIIDGMEKFLKIALKYAWAMQNKRSLQTFIEENPAFKNVPRDLAKGLVEITGIMFETKDEQETVNMSNALQELIDDGVKEGRKEG